MKRLIRFLTLTIAWLALLANIRIPYGRLFWLFASFKWLAGPVSPFLALFGMLGSLVGLLRRDWLTFSAGIAGSFLAVKHIEKVTTAHNEFTFAFGSDWPQRIPHHLQWRLKSKRYPARPLTSPPVSVAHDYVIGCHHETGDPLLADIWQPPDGTPPTGIGIIYLHGSGWHYLDKDFKGATRPLFQYLANQGYLVADVAYTLAPKATLIPMVADVKRAIAWMKANASDLNIHPDRIVLMGASAGAHLALLAAYTPNHPILDPSDVAQVDTAVRGVISLYGVSDIVSAHQHLAALPELPHQLGLAFQGVMWRNGMLPEYGRYVAAADMLPGLLGGSPEAEPEMAELASPILHVGPHCPPTLLINGTHDLALHVNQHRQLHAVLYRHQVPCVHIELECADHAFDIVAARWSPGAHASLHDIERFLALIV